MYSMMIELNPSLVFAEVSFPAPALEVYIEILSFGAQENVQLSDNEDASTEKAVRFDKPTGPSITLFFANLAATVTLLATHCKCKVIAHR